MNQKDKYGRFRNLSFEGFKELAKDTSLSKYEKIGFVDEWRENHEEFIFQDIYQKLNLFKEGKKKILDLGCGCSDLVTLLMAYCEKNNDELVLVDSEEMLALTPDSEQIENVKKIPGYFPDIPELCSSYQAYFSHIICYSVFHYIFTEGNIFKFIDKSLSLLEENGMLLLGDIPNFSKRNRFLNTPQGKEFHYKFMQTEEEPQVDFAVPLDEKIDDGVLASILLRYRNAGFETYLLPQAETLPLSKSREDILIRKVSL